MALNTRLFRSLLPSVFRRHHSTSNFSSVNPSEVQHFDALASSWWDPHGPSRLLHLMNPVRHDFIRSCLDSSSPQSLRYLDIGCGGGIFAESAARLPTTSHVTAIDPTPGVLAIARAHARRDPSIRLLPESTTLAPFQGSRGSCSLEYIQASIESLPVPQQAKGEAQPYDVVTLFEVLEHVASPAAVLERCAPFVRPGGWLVLSTIARTWTSWFTTILMAEDVLGVVPRGTHDWRSYINEDELRTHLTKHSEHKWENPQCMGVVYVPGIGWKEVAGSEKVGNYLFAVRKSES